MTLQECYIIACMLKTKVTGGHKLWGHILDIYIQAYGGYLFGNINGLLVFYLVFQYSDLTVDATCFTLIL